MSLVVLLMGAGCSAANSTSGPSLPTDTPTAAPTTKATPTLEPTSTPTTTAIPASEPTSTPHQPEPSPTAMPVPVDVVRRDLAQQLGVSPRTIEVVRVEDVLWPDTCLGLPAPELCARGETPGFRIVLKVDDQEYTYHTDEDQLYRYAGPGDFPQKP